jgi:hypothetical protein
VIRLKSNSTKVGLTDLAVALSLCPIRDRRHWRAEAVMSD